VLDGSKSNERALYWKQKILDVLCSKVESNNDNDNNDNNNYTMLSENHLVGTALFIFVKNSLLPKVSDVRTVSCGIGLLGIITTFTITIINYYYYYYYYHQVLVEIKVLLLQE